MNEGEFLVVEAEVVTYFRFKVLLLLQLTVCCLAKTTPL